MSYDAKAIAQVNRKFRGDLRYSGTFDEPDRESMTPEQQECLHSDEYWAGDTCSWCGVGDHPNV